MSFIVWGGAGLGVKLASALAAGGALRAQQIVLASKRGVLHAATVRAALSPQAAASVKVVGYDVDASDLAAVEATATSIAAAHPEPVSGFVYALGSIPLQPLRRVTAAQLLTTFTVNAAAGILALQKAAPQLTAAPHAGGSAVFFSSIAATTGFPNHVAIAAAKAAVEGAVRTAAAELAPRVRVNAIAPSLTLSPLGASVATSDAARKALGEAHPLPRLGSVDDLVAAALFLLDGASSGWMTGQVMHVDGGRSSVRNK
jgi:NAD(P)-dependent dehydrogenase (short-subunit alcohol dehydrogenase family)